MKKIVNLMILVMALSMFTKAFAADTKVNGRLYTDWHINMTDGADDANSFNITRAYVTVKSKLSDYTSLRITSDIKSIDGYDGYSVILKYGYIDWKPKFSNGNFKFRFGLQPTLYIDEMNGMWGHRYAMKTISDEQKFLTSADLGAGFFLNLGEKGKMGYAAFQIFNGTSYSDTKELNKNKDFCGFLQLNPFQNNENLKRSRIIGQAYIGTQNKTLDVFVDTSQTPIVIINKDASQFKHDLISIGGLLAYSNTFDLGIDLNFLKMGQGYSNAGTNLDDVKSSGISFFGALYLAGLSEDNSPLHTLNLFSRIDLLDPNTDVNNDRETMVMGGIECNPTKGFKASVNLRNTSFDDNPDSETYLYLNTLLKF